MQWIFMLTGLVLGWMLDESFSEALLGALLGLGIGQAIGIARLGSWQLGSGLVNLAVLASAIAGGVAMYCMLLRTFNRNEFTALLRELKPQRN